MVMPTLTAVMACTVEVSLMSSVLNAAVAGLLRPMKSLRSSPPGSRLNGGAGGWLGGAGGGVDGGGGDGAGSMRRAMSVMTGREHITSCCPAEFVTGVSDNGAP